MPKHVGSCGGCPHLAVLLRSANLHVSSRLFKVRSSRGSQLKSPAKIAGSQFHLIHLWSSARKHFELSYFACGPELWPVYP